MKDPYLSLSVGMINALLCALASVLDRRSVLRSSTAFAAAASGAPVSAAQPLATAPAAAAVGLRSFAIDAPLGLRSFAIDAPSELDLRSYRGLELSNGLRVLLASDPDPACRGTACMEVRVGSMNNPVEWPGLAHFCEHMLFLGTQRFPEESEFARVISSAGGSNNAFTVAEETTFHFDCRGEALPSALDRFSDFFVSPLFTETATAREIAAIDAEHSKNLLSDARRLDRLLRDRARPEHPFSHFFSGTRATLRGGRDGAREALLSFYARYYTADQMSLTVLGPQPLDGLQQLVVSSFGAIPSGSQRPGGSRNASSDYDALPRPLDPAAQGTAGTATLLVPVKELQIATVAWCVPLSNPRQWACAKPASVLARVLGWRGSAGLLAHLKRRGLASSCELRVDEATKTYALLTATLELTKRGLERWAEVVEALYSYLRFCREEGLPQLSFQETARLRELGVRFAEAPPPRAWAVGAVGALAVYAPRQWLTGPALVLAPSEGPAALAELLEGMVPSNGLVTLAARELAPRCSRKEPQYGAMYGTISIEQELRQWASAPRIEGLGAPPPNRFIPDRFERKVPLLPRRADDQARIAAAAPVLLVNEPAVRLHWLADRTFGPPKVYASFAWRSPSLCASASAAVHAELLMGLLGVALLEAGEEAAQAGLVYSVGVQFDALVLQVGGFDQQLPALAQLVAGTARTFPIRQGALNRRLDGLARSLRGLERRQPGALCAYYREQALQSVGFSTEELLAALGEVSLGSLAAFQSGLLAQAEVEAFVGGNVREAEARALLDRVRAALPCAPLPAASRAMRQVRRVGGLASRGGVTRQFIATTSEETNSAAEVYLQIGPDEGEAWRYLSLLVRMVSKPFFTELRTRQQLGYLVAASANEAAGVRGLLFSVQSTVRDPPQLEERIDAFLSGYGDTLARMSPSEFGAFRDAAAAQALDVDKRLDAQCARLWSECIKRRYDFERPHRTAERIRMLTLDGMRAFYEAFVAPDGERRQRLSTHVFAPRTAQPRTLQLDVLSGDLYPAEPDRLHVLLPPVHAPRWPLQPKKQVAGGGAHAQL